jgi:phage I-like protein
MAARIAIAAYVAEVKAPAGEIHLLPAGEFRSRDGRPKEAPAWRLDVAIAKRVIAAFAARRNPTVIDYEHQTLKVEENGQPAPAAGWFGGLEWREGRGLFATDVRWTPRAREMIAAGEYQYLSAVFTFTKGTGEVLEILHAGLTNVPAIDGLQALAAARFATQLNEDTDMNEELLKLLGLAAGSAPEAVIAALKAKLDALAAKDTEIAALKTGQGDPDPAKFVPVKVVEDLKKQLAALKAAGEGNPDPAKFVPVQVVEDLKKEIAALSKRLNDGDLEEMIANALEQKKLLPAQEKWARELGAKDLAALKSYLDQAQPIAALRGTQTSGKQPAGGGLELTDEELAICRQLGLTTEQFKQARSQENAA